MKSEPADQGQAVIPTGEVRVTVTTVRYAEPNGEVASQRESTAEGEFTSALRQALSQRLREWALHQVIGRVLARRPAQAQAIEYEGMFSPLRHLLILVQPSDGSTSTAKPKHVDLSGLFVPAAGDRSEPVRNRQPGKRAASDRSASSGAPVL